MAVLSTRLVAASLCIHSLPFRPTSPPSPSICLLPLPSSDRRFAMCCSSFPTFLSLQISFMLSKKGCCERGKKTTRTREGKSPDDDVVCPPSLPILRPSPPTPPSTRVLACTFRGGGGVQTAEWSRMVELFTCPPPIPFLKRRLVQTLRGSFVRLRNDRRSRFGDDFRGETAKRVKGRKGC